MKSPNLTIFNRTQKRESVINLGGFRKMDDLLGLLKVKVRRGINLAVRDAVTSDPYVVVSMGRQVSLFL